MRLKTINKLTSEKTASLFLSEMLSPRVRWGLGSIIVFLILWEVVGALNLVDPKYISQPSQVVKAGYELFTNGELIYHIFLSLLEIILGFANAVLLGLLLGMLMGYYRVIGGFLDPILMALYATPRVALIPLFVVWFGVGMGSKVFVVFMGALFPIIVNTMTGIRQVDRILLRAARSFGASDWQIFTKILLPGALPEMMTGIRLGWGRGILGMVIGEMYVSMGGLGYLISKAGNAMQTDQLLFLIVIVALIGYLTTIGFQQLERKLRHGERGELGNEQW